MVQSCTQPCKLEIPCSCLLTPLQNLGRCPAQFTYTSPIATQCINVRSTAAGFPFFRLSHCLPASDMAASKTPAATFGGSPHTPRIFHSMSRNDAGKNSKCQKCPRIRPNQPWSEPLLVRKTTFMVDSVLLIERKLASASGRLGSSG